MNWVGFVEVKHKNQESKALRDKKPQPNGPPIVRVERVYTPRATTLGIKVQVKQLEPPDRSNLRELSVNLMAIEYHPSCPTSLAFGLSVVLGGKDVVELCKPHEMY